MDLANLKVSSHARKRYGERINKHGTKAIDYFKEILPLSNPVGKIIGDDNRLADCYLYENKKIIVRNNEVVTIVIPKHNSSENRKKIQHKLCKVYRSELNRLIRDENKQRKYLIDLKMLSEIEIAELNYKIYKSRSPSVKLACQSRIVAIKQTIQQYEIDLKELYKEKSYISSRLAESHN